MTKTITAMLVGIALEQGEIASLDDPATKYLPELAGSGYDGVTIRQILQMRSGVDYQERYDFGANPSFAGRLHEQAIVLNRMRFADGALEPRRAQRARQHVQLLDARHLRARLGARAGDRASRSGPVHAGICGARSAPRPTASGSPTGRPAPGASSAGMGFNATLRDFGRLGQLMLRRRRARRRADPARRLGRGDDRA